MHPVHVEMEYHQTGRAQHEPSVPRMSDDRVRAGCDERVGVSMPLLGPLSFPSTLVSASRCVAWATWPWIWARVELAEGVVCCGPEERACEGEGRSCDGHERQGWEGRGQPGDERLLGRNRNGGGQTDGGAVRREQGKGVRERGRPEEAL